MTSSTSQRPAHSAEVLVDLDPNPTPKLRSLGGGQDDRWNNRIANRVMAAVPGNDTAERRREAAGGILAGLVNLNPADPIEGMLIGQVVAAHEAALDLYRRAWIPEQGFEVRTKFLALA